VIAGKVSAAFTRPHGPLALIGRMRTGYKQSDDVTFPTLHATGKTT
jgi:hypothetical protein